jgi:hypothetical protein
MLRSVLGRSIARLRRNARLCLPALALALALGAVVVPPPPPPSNPPVLDKPVYAPQVNWNS